jgi:NTE family protein
MTGRASQQPGAPRGLAGPKAEKTISLALQGGGAHGAFTWGVLDAILEDGRSPSRRSPEPAPAP